MLVWWASAISTDRDSIDLISRLDRSHFPFPSAISTDRDSIVSFPICSATRSISFRDSINSHLFIMNSAISTDRDSIDLISHSIYRIVLRNTCRSEFRIPVPGHNARGFRSAQKRG